MVYYRGDGRVAKRGVLLFCLFALFMTNKAEAGSEHQLEIGTFNIRWFGSAEHDQTYQLPTTKAVRVSAVKDFLAKEMLPLDIVAFQEIVDFKALKSVLPKGWRCESYSHPFKLHQHVAICASPNYKLNQVPYDTDNVINETAYYDVDRARPTMRVDVSDRSGTRLIRMVAVHLKSAPNFALLRLKQVGMIARDLQNDPTLPVIVTGDFNSFSHTQTKLETDDVPLIERQLNQSGLSFRHIPHKAAYTFRNGRVRGQFDHFFVSKMVTSTTQPKVFAVCNHVKDGVGYENAAHYLRYVSDHCPVKIKVKF